MVAVVVLIEYTEASSYFLESASQFESLDAPLGACHAQVDLALTLRLYGRLPAALSGRPVAQIQTQLRIEVVRKDNAESIQLSIVTISPSDLLPGKMVISVPRCKAPEERIRENRRACPA